MLKSTLVQARTLAKLANVIPIVVREHAAGEDSLRDLQVSRLKLTVYMANMNSDSGFSCFLGRS